MQFNLSEITFILYEKNSRKKIISFLRTCFSIFWSAISMWRWLLWFQFAPKKNLWSKKPYLSKSRWPLGNQNLFIFNQDDKALGSSSSAQLAQTGFHFLMRFLMSAAGWWRTPESSWPELTGTEPFLNQLGWFGRRGRYPCKNLNHAGQHWAFSFGYLRQAHRYQIYQFKLIIWRRKKKKLLI